MSTDSQKMQFGSMWTDPVVLLGSVVSAFGLIGIVDTALEWRAFFNNFVAYWATFRDLIFSIIPVNLPDFAKDLIVINTAAASIMLRSGYILEKNGFKVKIFFRKTVIWSLVGSTIYTIFFYIVLFSVMSWIVDSIYSIELNGILDFIRDIVGKYIGFFFLAPLVALPLFIVMYAYEGFNGNRDRVRAGDVDAIEKWTVSMVIVSNAVLMFALVAVIILFCAKW